MERPISGRIKALDGYRGVAVLTVMLRHLCGAPGTWAGVDIFFVLSGFLITTILRGEREDPNFWKVFYIRRMTRIVPAFLILLLGVAVLLRLEWHKFWFYFAFFGANLAMINLGDTVIGPLSVVWSLAVEEHFYFIWPVNVRYFSDKTLTWILLGIIAAEPFIRVLSLHLMPDWHIYYYLTPFRLDGLAMGCLLSILISQPAALARIERGLVPALAVVTASCFVFFGLLHYKRETVWMFNAFGYTLVALASGVFLTWLILRPGSVLTRIMSFGPLCFLGRVSYGLYLYHTLMRDFINHIALRFGYSHPYRTAVITFPLSIFLAWLSFEFIERRFLDFGRRKVGAYRTVEGPVHTTS